ncbi:tetratricopeptide repeat-containing diguanylate cyclase [Psychrobacillus sp. FSL K6-2836]|uniref:GGDEF domain-containing protein n=1 Tax=Psychrobacillus sp. FSL K6-2836 TaxID=2921548 RepID=UPI0030F8A6E0
MLFKLSEYKISGRQADENVKYKGDVMLSQPNTLMMVILEIRKTALKYPEEAFERASGTYEEACILQAREEEAASLYVMAVACRSMTRLESCFDYAYDAYQIYDELEDLEGVATALNLIGVAYFYNAMYEQSMENFLKAMRVLSLPKDAELMSRIYNNIGEIYRKIGNTEEALIAYLKALDLSQQSEVLMNSAVIMGNIGQVYFQQGDLKASYNYYQESYEMLLRLDNVASLAEVENKIGKIYYLQKDLDLAKQFYVQSLSRLETIGNKYYAIDVLVDLAEYEVQFNEQLFLQYLNKAINYAETIQAREKSSHIFKKLSDFYESKGNHDLALDYYKKFHQMEQMVGSTAISQRLEIIKLELNKLYAGEEIEEIENMYNQLENEIAAQKKMMEELQKTNLHLSGEVFYDDLTQLPNRKYVTKYLKDVWDLGSEDLQVALCMIDIDHFKRYNDFHGHMEGDHCLQQVADCMKSVMDGREGILGRFGGEEFVCFLKDISREEFAQFAETLRDKIEKLSLLYCWEQHSFHVTISVGGVHGICSQFKDKAQMYSIADEELYRAKSTGRNNVKIIFK